MTATADWLETEDMADVAFVLLWDGLSFGYTTHPDLAGLETAWAAALGDETFEMRPGLKLQGRVSRSIKLFEARVQPSSQTFSILDDEDETLGALLFGEGRTDIKRTRLARSCTASATTIYADDVASIPGPPDRLYLGLETLVPSAADTAENTWTVARGQFATFRVDAGSEMGRNHDVSYEGDERPEITDVPVKWVNRVLSLFICHRVDGVWSAGIAGTTANDAHLDWCGRLKTWGEGGDGWIDLDCVEITERLQTTIGASMYAGTLALGAFISAGQEELQIKVRVFDILGNTILSYPAYVTTFSFVGTRVPHQVAAEGLNAWFADAFVLNSGTYGPAGMFMHMNREGGSVVDVYTLRASILTATDAVDVEVRVSMNEAMWRLFGFASEQRRNPHAAQTVAGSVEDVIPDRQSTTTWAAIARGLPKKLVQKNVLGADELVVQRSTEQAFLPQTYFPPGFASSTTGFLAIRVGGSDERYIGVRPLSEDRFGITGEWRGAQKAKITSADTAAFVEADDDGQPIDVRQVWIEPYSVANGGGGIGPGIARLILSTTTLFYNHFTYDTLPIGGAGVPAQLVDVDSIVGFASADIEWYLVLLKPAPINKLIEAALNLVGAQLVWKDGLLTIIRPVELADPAGLIVLDETNKAEKVGPGEILKAGPQRAAVTRNPEAIINRSTLRYQLLSNGTWDRTEIVNAKASQSDAEQIKNATVDAIGIYGPDDSTTQPAAVIAWKSTTAALQLAYFSRAVGQLVRSFDFSLVTKLYPGARVSIDDLGIINPATGRRGVAGLLAYIVATEWDWATGVGRATAVFQPDAVTTSDVTRLAVWAPSARVDETYGAEDSGVLLDTQLVNAVGTSLSPSAAVHTFTGFDPTDVLVITHPGGMTYDAWSPWNADTSPPVTPEFAGLPWSHGFKVGNGLNVIIESISVGNHPSAGAALAAFQAAEPYRLSGETTYKIFGTDPFTIDNRGGLSLQLDRYSAPSHAGYDDATKTLYFKPHEYSLPDGEVDVSWFQDGDEVEIVELSPPDPANPLKWRRTIATVNAGANAVSFTVGLSSPAWPDRGHFVMHFAPVDEVNADQLARGAFIADETLRSTGLNPNDAYLWGADVPGGGADVELEQDQPYRRLSRLDDDMGSAASVHKLHEIRDWLNTFLAWTSRPTYLNVPFLQPATYTPAGASEIMLVPPVRVPLVPGTTRSLEVRVLAAMATAADGGATVRVMTSRATPTDDQDFEEPSFVDGINFVDLTIPETDVMAWYTGTIEVPALAPGPVPGCYIAVTAIPEFPGDGQVLIGHVKVMEAEPA